MVDDENDKEISLDKWIEVARSDLERFYDYWRSQQNGNPETFPDQMWPGDWDEAFMTWRAEPPESVEEPSL